MLVKYMRSASFICCLAGQNIKSAISFIYHHPLESTGAGVCEQPRNRTIHVNVRGSSVGNVI
jgi:hypothetical protein